MYVINSPVQCLYPDSCCGIEEMELTVYSSDEIDLSYTTGLLRKY